MNQRDIGEAGPSTPKHAAGSVAKRLAMLPRVATTPKGKGKGKGKAREEEEEEEFIELIQDTFTNKYLVSLLCWQKALTVVDISMGAGVVLKRAKGKTTPRRSLRNRSLLLEPAVTTTALMSHHNQKGLCYSIQADDKPNYL
ncbi:hypothetical protein H2248_005957 [Termitomyces sp. 'cryptogamus']|nr:hypothetical protein H2248_005957 [Termitomyces sp. 'cryptogamus']